MDISGIYPPIVTPFNADETIAYDKLQQNMEKWNKIPFRGIHDCYFFIFVHRDLYTGWFSLDEFLYTSTRTSCGFGVILRLFFSCILLIDVYFVFRIRKK
jgi:hypothetical protein